MSGNKIVMGMDVGGTKTRALLVDSAGTVLGEGVGASGNTNFVTLEQAEASFGDAIGAAQKQAGIGELAVEVIVCGTEPDPVVLHPFLNRIAHPKKIIHKKEGECSLVGGLVEPTGLSLIAGTGSVGWGRNKQGRTHMTSCWGIIGDEGSAYDLARRGVNAAFWAYDGRGPQTKLVDKLCQKFEIADLRDACTPIYTNPDVRRNFASLSRMVMETADEGDEVAIEVVKEGARQIAHFLAACAEVLDMQDGPYKVAATGGLVSSGGWYFDLIQEDLRARHAQATLVTPRFDPVVGAALIALAEIGVEWDGHVVNNLEKSLNP